jgi:uncharacterized membrane protein
MNVRFGTPKNTSADLGQMKRCAKLFIHLTEKGKTMKWIKEHKKEIIGGVQFFLITQMMVQGFWFTFLWIWFVVGLPIEWRALLITILLALLSAFGLYQWVTKESGNGNGYGERKDNGSKQQG